MTMKLTPFINLKRNAKEAIQFYEKAIDAKVLTMITYGDMPEMPNTYRDDLKGPCGTRKATNNLLARVLVM